MGRALALGLVLGLGGCGPSSAPAPDAGSDAGVPFAVEVVRFEPGQGAGFGQDAFPDVVLGPPQGAGEGAGSEHVLSLGLGGVIELRLGMDVIDGEGPDLLVFENPFRSAFGDYVEPGQVSVSDDGEAWHAFPCAPKEAAPNGCAGYEPVLASRDGGQDPTCPEEAGGDRFDLADLGVERVRFVRIEDRNVPGGLQGEPTAGFDLDAVAVVNGE